MIKRFQFGSPIETDAVLVKPELSNNNEFFLEKEGKSFIKKLSQDEAIYGLGEAIRGINKRGWIYESVNADEPHHLEEKRSLYGSHNFLLFDGDTVKGVFFDSPEKITFDLGYTKNSECVITFDSMNVDVYEIDGDTPEDVVTAFRKLIGKSYIPPKWAFGYGQSRWGYQTSDDFRKVRDEYKALGIPLDMIYMDIDYMDGYRDFTINQDTFADFDELVKEMKENHIHLIPIIDAAVKKDDNYKIYQEGRDHNYFVKDEDGDDLVVGVWPGKSCLPDFLNDEARAWFGDHYNDLISRGIDGFWNDMNEPAIFYIEKTIAGSFDVLQTFRGKNLDANIFFDYCNTIPSMSNDPNYYEKFFHNYKGKKIAHKDVHNLYGYFMTRSAKEAFDRIDPTKRILMFSRSSYIGMHRYAGIWQGDNRSWWSHLLMNIKMMPSLNMVGFLYTGADLGGFGADTTEDLVARWLSFACFTPLMRNHAERGTREQEIYQFESKELLGNMIKLRYRLIPYIYSEYMKAVRDDKCMFRPLSFVYREDKIARTIEDQLLLGDELMIAPVYTQNAIGRMVYVPEKMEMIRFTGDEVTERTVYEKGSYFIEMPLGDTCIFLRENKEMPLAKRGMMYVQNVAKEEIEMLSFGDNVSTYELYDDDGITAVTL